MRQRALVLEPDGQWWVLVETINYIPSNAMLMPGATFSTQHLREALVNEALRGVPLDGIDIVCRMPLLPEGARFVHEPQGRSL